jgi:hypothetical protein
MLSCTEAENLDKQYRDTNINTSLQAASIFFTFFYHDPYQHVKYNNTQGIGGDTLQDGIKSDPV